MTDNYRLITEICRTEFRYVMQIAYAEPYYNNYSVNVLITDYGILKRRVC
jgi:hypothetical protein